MEGNNYLEGNGEVGGKGNAELLLVDEDDGDLNPYLRTSDFKVYRLDLENGNFDRVPCLSDQHHYFCRTVVLCPFRQVISKSHHHKKVIRKN